MAVGGVAGELVSLGDSLNVLSFDGWWPTKKRIKTILSPFAMMQGEAEWDGMCRYVQGIT